MQEIHPDRDSYEIIWKKVIEEEIYNYLSIYTNCIELIPNVKEEIWLKYVSLNTYCKTNYMKSPTEKIDRHKVAACYMIAIAMLRPMRFVEKINGQEVPLAINETLAITVGLSLVRAFAIAAIRENRDIGQEDADKLVAKFESGIKLPEEHLVNHGVYLDNYANEIHFATSEGKICILSLAHELYLLEVITRVS
ncbi:MAG: hypothetical protein NC543_14495 [bacterium]|nr:hypothetical protein [bacterium]MCM1376551.1 hypothetical protein [Muribaculum sp.]